MAQFVAVRAAGLVLVLLTMIALVFALQRIIPGDPARAIAGPTAPAATVDRVRSELGLDDPLPAQFGRYLAGLARGDLGESTRTNNTVVADLAANLPASLELMAVALMLGIAGGVGVAVLDRLLPRAGALRLGLVAAASAPLFFTAIVLLLAFWFWLPLLPSGGRSTLPDPGGPTGLLLLDGLVTGRPEVSADALDHLLLPGLTLSLPIAAAVGRTLRSSLAGVMRSDHIRTARSKGLSERRVLLRHGVRNASTAPLAMAGLQVGLLFANLLVVEQIFAWPGLGLYTTQSLGASDLPGVLGVALVFGVAYVVLNALVDVAQAWVDPRIGVAGA